MGLSGAVSVFVPTYAEDGWALTAKDIEYMASEYRTRRDYVVQKVRELGWSTTVPGGAFYLWPDISNSGMDSETFARKLLEHAKIAVVPGTVFGDEYLHHIRLTYSYSMDVLEKAFARIEAFVRNI